MIAIQQPELEALIYKRLQAGPFSSIEEVLMQALSDAPLPSKKSAEKLTSRTGADVIAAFQRSPYKEINLERNLPSVQISDPVEF